MQTAAALFHASALHGGSGVAGVELVEAFARLARDDSGLCALSERSSRLFGSAGNAVQTGQVDPAVLNAVADEVALLDAPEKRPSVISATEPLILSSQTIASVVATISGMPHPRGPS